jgi:hypothetical protein
VQQAAVGRDPDRRAAVPAGEVAPTPVDLRPGDGPVDDVPRFAAEASTTAGEAELRWSS